MDRPNRRFTILAPKGSRPNLASRLLGMSMRELPVFWEAKWGCRPLLAETFCDIDPPNPRVGRTRIFSVKASTGKGEKPTAILKRMIPARECCR